MVTTLPNIAPKDFSLDLTEGLIVSGLGRSVGVLEPSGLYDSLDTALLTRKVSRLGGLDEIKDFVALFRAGRLTESGAYLEVERYELDLGHAIYGKKLVEGTAFYADGATEGWRIQVDPLNVRWSWARQPDRLGDRLVLRVIAPHPTGRDALWQTGRGVTFHRECQATLVSDDEKELLCIGPTAKNSFRIEIPTGGDLSIARLDEAASELADEEGWGGAQVPALEARWVLPAVAVLQMSATWGLAHATRDFQGRWPFVPVDATLDFDVFYSRICLAALPLYLSCGPHRSYQPLASLERGAGAAPLEDIVAASEFLPLADPRAAGVLIRDTIDARLDDVLSAAGRTPRDAALLLLLAGRHGEISGDPDFLGGRLGSLRQLADTLLRRRVDEDPIPLVDTEDGPAKEPVFTALCFAGLKRLAAIEHAFALPDHAKKWLTAAESMRRAALQPTNEGGLLHPARRTFVRHVVPGKSADAPPQAVRTEFLLRQFVLPCALGLVDELDIIQKAYDWIDDQYTYATGRGGASCPPGAERALYALLDVYIRQRHGILGTDRVLQLVLDHALDFGVPMLGRPYEARRAPEANFADAAPYLGIVLGLHYGLEYSKDGWQLGTPKPLPNYPLTRVTGLRHKYAVYSVTWQGRGRIKRIVINGRTHRATLLADADGEHEVVVYLG